MRLGSPINAVHRQLVRRLHRRIAPLTGWGPIVSFTFDDFPRSAALTGGTILERYGARGTYYTAMDLMNCSGEAGELFHASDLEELLEKGHELASHTFGHISARAVPRDRFLADANRGRQALEKFSGSECGNFAYPFGEVALPVKAALGPQITSARGIIPGINGPDEVDLNLLLANSLYGDVAHSGHAEALIKDNMRCKGWLIFYTHDVQMQPSPYGCTPELFEAVASFAAESGTRLLTIQNTIELMADASSASATRSGDGMVTRESR